MLNLDQIELELDNAHRKAAQALATELRIQLGPRPQTFHISGQGLLMVDNEPWWAGQSVHREPIYAEIQTALNSLQGPTLKHLQGVTL